MKLTKNQRESVKTFLFSGLTYRDISKKLQISLETLKKSFNVPSLELKFGVEIEGFSVASREEIKNIIDNNSTIDISLKDWENQSTKEKNWIITTDGSINLPTIESNSTVFPERKGYEIVSPPLVTKKEIKDLKKILEIVRNPKLMGHKIYLTNKSCSVHIHLCVEQLEKSEIKKIYNLYQYFEEDIDKMLPASRIYDKSRNNNSSYCESISNLSFADAFKGDYGKYWSLKISSSIPTIEFRKHSGSTSFIKIRNWILILQQLYNFAISNEDIYKMSENKRNSLSLHGILYYPVLMAYYNERKRKFDKQKLKYLEYI
jgi:hypothetical protein